MKRIPAFLLCLVLLLNLSGCVTIVDNAQTRVIGIVSREDGSPFWNSVLRGAEDAALENGYAITFRGPDPAGTDGVEQQRKILELALENQVCGLIVAAAGPGLEDLMELADERNLPVIQFDSGLAPKDLAELKQHKKKPVVSSVYTDNVSAGELSAEHLFRRIRRDITLTMVPYVVGIVQHDLSAEGEERTAGFLRKFQLLADEDPETRGKYVLKLEKCPASQDNAYGKALDRLKKQGCRAVFLTSQEAVNQVYDHILTAPGRYDYMVFTGFDAGKKQLAWLQSDIGAELIGSVAQNAYAIGYNAVTQCVNGLEARGVTAFVEVDGAWYDRDNLQEMLDKSQVYE